jgi:hypothetical protein
MILPQRNSRITVTVKGGTSEDYEDLGGDGAAVELPNFECYAAQRRATATEAGALNQTTISYAIVPGDTGFDWAPGDAVLIVFDDGSSWVRTVREVRAPRLSGLPPLPVKLDFKEA